MAKTLNELAGELKTLIIELQSDAHNQGSIRVERYNNLKLIMEPAKNSSPHVIVDLAMADAEFDIRTGQKLNGGLGADERYVLRWFNKANTLSQLQEAWNNAVKNRGKAKEAD